MQEVNSSRKKMLAILVVIILALSAVFYVFFSDGQEVADQPDDLPLALQTDGLPLALSPVEDETKILLPTIPAVEEELVAESQESVALGELPVSSSVEQRAPEFEEPEGVEAVIQPDAHQKLQPESSEQGFSSGEAYRHSLSPTVRELTVALAELELDKVALAKAEVAKKIYELESFRMPIPPNVSVVPVSEEVSTSSSTFFPQVIAVEGTGKLWASLRTRQGNKRVAVGDIVEGNKVTKISLDSVILETPEGEQHNLAFED